MPPPDTGARDRRPLKTRGRPLAHQLAAGLGRRGATPNGISVVGVLLAGGAGTCFALLPESASPTGRALLLLGAALFIQLRLASNLLDGLVAGPPRRATGGGRMIAGLIAGLTRLVTGATLRLLRQPPAATRTS